MDKQTGVKHDMPTSNCYLQTINLACMQNALIAMT